MDINLALCSKLCTQNSILEILILKCSTVLSNLILSRSESNVFLHAKYCKLNLNHLAETQNEMLSNVSGL